MDAIIYQTFLNHKEKIHQAWNFEFERARNFSFCKGYFRLKVLSLSEASERAPRPRTGATEDTGLHGLCVIPGLFFFEDEE